MSGNALRARILRHVEALGNVVNLLVWRCLRPENEADQADAFQGLVGCCFVACRWRGKGIGVGALYALPISDESGLDIVAEFNKQTGVAPKGSLDYEFRRQATRDFIEHDLNLQLDWWAKLGPALIDQLALHGAFKWTVRQTRNALIDEIRWVYRQAGREERLADLPKRDCGTDRGTTRVLLRVMRARFEAAIGERGWRLLMLLVGAMPLGRTRREWKAEATRLVAAIRKISLRQARREKAAILQATEGELVEKIVRQILLDARNDRFRGSLGE